MPSGFVHSSYLPTDWLTLVWTHPLSQIGNTWVLLQHFCPIMKIGCFPSLVMVEFPVLFGSKVLLAQNHHFGWFPSFFFMVYSVVWLQCIFHLKSSGRFPFLWFPVLFGSKVLSVQNYHFGWFPSLVTVSSVVWLPSAFCSKMNILLSSFHLLWFPVLFGSNGFSTQNQHFWWFPSLFMVPSVVWLQSALCSICWTVEFELLLVVWTILDLEQEFWIIWETKVFTFHTYIQVRCWDIIMQILDGFFRVKPENIGFATCMKNIGLRFASSDIFHTCSSSNIFRYHPQAIQYCIKLGLLI